MRTFLPRSMTILPEAAKAQMLNNFTKAMKKPPSLEKGAFLYFSSWTNWMISLMFLWVVMTETSSPTSMESDPLGMM